MVYSEDDLKAIGSAMLYTVGAMIEGRVEGATDADKERYLSVLRKIKDDMESTVNNRKATAAAREKGVTPKCSH